MSYVHVRVFVEASLPVVKNLLRDNDPYVRKTAAFCVAKLFDHDKQMVEKSGLIDRLNMLLRDDNPTVVASALAALMDIWERSDNIKLTIDYSNASKMVTIMPDCSEYVPPQSVCLSVARTKRMEADCLFSALPCSSIQMGPDIYSGSSHDLCPTKFIRGAPPG
jgi:hypothetical protein